MTGGARYSPRLSREGKLELTRTPRSRDRGCGNSRRFPPGQARADRSGRSMSETRRHPFPTPFPREKSSQLIRGKEGENGTIHPRHPRSILLGLVRRACFMNCCYPADLSQRGDPRAVADSYLKWEQWKEASVIQIRSPVGRRKKKYFLCFDRLHCAYTERGRKRGVL